MFSVSQTTTSGEVIYNTSRLSSEGISRHNQTGAYFVSRSEPPTLKESYYFKYEPITLLNNADYHLLASFEEF